jgi:hypothetical protein
MNPSFTKSGKAWNNIGHLKNHLRQHFDRRAYRGLRAELYDNAEIIAIEIVETEVEKIPVPEMITEMLEKDLEAIQQLADKYPQSQSYQDAVVDTKNQLMLMKAKRNETR